MMLAHDFLSLIFDYVDEGANVKVSCNGVGRHLSCSRLNFFLQNRGSDILVIRKIKSILFLEILCLF